ncbi:hypothetical protein M413DRAFT_447145 [Hebeloma cylindrosporum]|uniref:Uncharacterized protein n=1 Tax=Hebeloma cylindrosporum TaxID=76867 RepID=A0A0C3C6H4_HEBCY|nr:hypothetical protein M413DRAFT_447145 [Hebeloma cylindrosporum h7]
MLWLIFHLQTPWPGLLFLLDAPKSRIYLSGSPRNLESCMVPSVEVHSALARFIG